MKRVNVNRRSFLNKTKPYRISKNSVVAVWERVKANKGSYGIDEQSIQGFSKELKDNLYKMRIKSNKNKQKKESRSDVKELEFELKDVKLENRNSDVLLEKI